MLYVGLTGNIASGKTEVARRFRAHGATVVDADVLAREAVLPGTTAYNQVVARWGKDVIAEDGSLDRKSLRGLVFSDQEQLEALNEMVHPWVTRLRKKAVTEARARGDTVLIYVAPLLFERRLAHEFDKIVLIDSPKGVRLDRLVRLRDITPEDATNMIAAQMPAELKRARADFVIENEGTLVDLMRQTDAVWERLTASDSKSSLAG